MHAPRCPMEKSVREKEVLVLAHSSIVCVCVCVVGRVIVDDDNST